MHTAVKRAERLLVTTSFYDEAGTGFHTTSLQTFYTTTHPPAASQLVVTGREEELSCGKTRLGLSVFADMSLQFERALLKHTVLFLTCWFFSCYQPSADLAVCGLSAYSDC